MTDREKLLALLRTADKEDYSSKTQDEHYAYMADRLMESGVTIPVLCKKCKHMEVTPDKLRWCNVWNGINGMGEDGFCNYGERKDKC